MLSLWMLANVGHSLTGKILLETSVTILENSGVRSFIAYTLHTSLFTNIHIMNRTKIFDLLRLHTYMYTHVSFDDPAGERFLYCCHVWP